MRESEDVSRGTPFLEAVGWNWAGQSCSCMPGVLECSDGGGKEGTKPGPNCHDLPSSPRPPQHGKIELKLIKAAGCLEMKGEGWREFGALIFPSCTII